MDEIIYEYKISTSEKLKWINQCNLLEEVMKKMCDCNTEEQLKECIIEFDEICANKNIKHK
jgi:hypothetical protein